ncbi:enoyl-CoA hydratase/isomerase family protein [Methylocystis rosea]|uniref:Enoyl-CoA hydratase/isomerase family protein n=1 Tax=Methylocystis rosea TaxID=173366 RepID=A0A3G8M6I3_9HYPH|nr:enoyl-CoA hydratase/isomerase family protein [Methylocystis rosea]AZG77357.1 enoyl-CoA hydratase/isomerase family protein [Methylocystis rosea]
MTPPAVQDSRTPAAEAPVQWTLDGAVAVVTMTKPPHNLLDDAMLEALVAAYRAAVEAGARAILLRSALRHFCAGAEVKSFGVTTVIHTDPVKFAALLEGLESIPVPTVAALNGGVLGGGLEIALTCDMILAADSAFVGQVEVAVGLHPMLGGTQRLVQRAGVARAKEIAMLGRRHSPQAFERWGVINLVVPEEELGAVSLTWARQLAAGPTRILGGIKMLANESARAGIAAADRRQVEINAMIWATEDRKRGIEAFLKTGPGTAVYEGN